VAVELPAGARIVEETTAGELPLWERRSSYRLSRIPFEDNSIGAFLLFRGLGGFVHRPT
jgi:hypothetical protein